MPVSHILASSLAGSDDFHDLARLYAEPFADGVLGLDLWQLMWLDPILAQELVFLLLIQYRVFWHKMMLRDIDLNVFKRENFDCAFKLLGLLLGNTRKLMHNNDDSISIQMNRVSQNALHLVPVNFRILA